LHVVAYVKRALYSVKRALYYLFRDLRGERAGDIVLHIVTHVCVCERERARAREREFVRARKRARERESTYERGGG